MTLSKKNRTSTKPAWWWWLYVIIPLTTVIITLLSQFLKREGTTIADVNTNSKNSKTVNQSAVNSPGAIQVAAEHVTLNTADPTLEIRKNMKQKLRQFLTEANPESIEQIDSGAKEVYILFGIGHKTEFQSFSRLPEFSQYFSEVRIMGNVMMHAERISLNGHKYIDDLNEPDMVTPFLILPTEDLRK